MQSSNLDAAAFQNSIYRSSPSFDPGSFKASHAGYTSKTNSDASNFYSSYINPASAYSQAMPAYGCRDPPPYMDASFFRHPSPCFMQNLGGGPNYYEMASSRQVDVNDYGTSGLLAVTTKHQDSFLGKPVDPLPYNHMQVDPAFNSDNSINSISGNMHPSIGNILPVSDISSPLTTQNHFQHHQHQGQHHIQHNEDLGHKSPLLPIERQHNDYGSNADPGSIYESVKLDNTSHPHHLIPGFDKQPFDSTIPSLCHQGQTPVTFSTCPDIKPTITTSHNTATKAQTPPTHTITTPQPTAITKHENFDISKQPLSPKSFQNQQNCITSESVAQENASSSNKDASGTVNDNAASDPAKPTGSEESGEGKPTMSYIALIAKAILESDQRRLNLGSIYHWIEKHYPFYKNKGQGWRNSVRHNLSLNDCFIKAGRCEDGKGNYWAIHPANIQDFIRGDFRQRRRSRRRGRKKECDLGLYHVPNGYLPPPAPPLTSGMTFNPGTFSSIYSPYTEAERRAYRLDEALLRQSMNNPFVKWYHQQQPGAPATHGYGVPTSPHPGCSAPGLYPNSAAMQWPHQTYAADTSAQNMYPALNSAFPR